MQVLEFGANTDQQYISIVKPKLLTRNFLSKYIDKQPPFGQLGLIVYLRTYSRFIPQLKRREKWWETCLRVVEYSFSLLPDKPRKPSYFTQEKQKEEAEALFDTLFNLRGFTSGRTLFVGGSEASRLYPSSNFNCSYCNVDSLKSFADAMYLLLLGCGVGYSVESKHVSKLPKFNPNTKVSFKLYEPKEKNSRKQQTDLTGHTITVGDSKEGWVSALVYFLDLHSSSSTQHITLNFDSVRPEGERLKTFGGRASGYIPLQTMFEEIHDRITSTDSGVIDSVTAMDIMNSIAKAIVVGGVRRSSQIAFGDVNDINFRDAKKDLWSDPEKAKYSTTRVLSNNSVHIWQRPTFDRLLELFETIKNNGEPALSIAGNASLRRENYSGSNPCHEILLDNLGVCNLTTQNLLSFVDEFGNFLFDAAIRAVKLLTRVGSRITLVDMWDKDWDYVQKRDRLLGVSLTGIVEAYNALNDTEKLNWEYYITELRKAARNEADLYHDALGIPRSYLVTTLKPEGTLSQLPTVSSGVHAPYAPYYTRRIRISKRDPIANALLDLGLVPVPENGQGNDIHADECNTWVFSFSVKTKAQIRAIDESAIEQLERYKFFMKNWAEHTVSVTITVAENEWDGVVSWVWENWEYCIGIAFLPRFDPAELDSPYPNMPYESSTETDYQPIEISESQLVSLISKYETEYEEYDLDASCGGLTACPVR
jgi:ribonucleoside-diphosphate reductase alpha chain/ribonucleoside-triphosphate reductase